MKITKQKSEIYSESFSKNRKIIEEQIELYFELLNPVNQVFKKYNIGDNVILNKNNYLHGIGQNTSAIELIRENRIISKEATGDFGNHAFRFVVGLWNVKNTISLKEYIRNYSGMDVNYNDVNELVPYGKLDDFVEKMKHVVHWLWRG